MISNRRTSAPILMIALATLALLARQAYVQTTEHVVWSEEAARLERSGEVIPYRRGAIQDATGKVLVRDVEAYHMDFAYRDFRRGHPLGLVAHAASVLLLEPVKLTLALEFAGDWGLRFVELTPGELDDFARGVGIDMGRMPGLPATAVRLAVAPEKDERRSLDLARRSGDLGFYIGRLLQLTKSETKALLRAGEDTRRRDVPYVDLVAKQRGISGAELRAGVREQIEDGLADLDLLAVRMRFGGDVQSGARPAAALAFELETWRQGIEDAAASRLFREATGFTPGRLEPGTLLEYFELDWISVYLRWSPARLAQWAVDSRRSWLHGWRETVILPRLMAALRSREVPDAGTVALVLSAPWYRAADLAAVLDGDRTPLADREGLDVVSRWSDVFLADMGDGLEPDDARLPWAMLAETAGSGESSGLDGSALEVAYAELGPALERRGSPAHTAVERALADARASGFPTTRAARWFFHFKTPDYRSREILGDLAAELADAWELRYQELLVDVLETARGGAASDELDAAGALRLDPLALDRAADRARFVLRDFGMRRNLLDERPDYEVVQLLTRYPDHFPGFAARDARERQALVQLGEEGLPGALLLGNTALLDAELAQAQRSDARRLAELRHLGKRTAAEGDELVALVARVLTYREERGVSGIEGSWNDMLRGTNGYRERVGLEEVEGRRGHRSSLREVENGRELRLTLEAELERVAEEVLERPVIPERADKLDRAWIADPEGAIVIVRPNGDVVVAASGPAPWSPRVTAKRPAVERCFRQPDFQPPGSIFKPFAGLFALESGKLKATDVFECLADSADVGSIKGVYRGVHCHKNWGHSTVFDAIDLARALRVSCNVYFAHVGELLTQGEFWQVAHDFGLGEPTGILRPDGPRGLVENTVSDLFTKRLGLKDRMRAANGLSVIQATPAQLARAAMGLATGKLPELRLVDAARPRTGGAFEVLPRAEPKVLPYSAANFEVIRAAMAGVAASSEGSAHTALSKDEIGFEVFVKTGSADLAERDAEGRMVKHTWVLGWANNAAGEPAVAFVFFVRKTVTTSSHSSVWVARQFFLRPEVRAFLRGEGVVVDDVEREVAR